MPNIWNKQDFSQAGTNHCMKVLWTPHGAASWPKHSSGCQTVSFKQVTQQRRLIPLLHAPNIYPFSLILVLQPIALWQDARPNMSALGCLWEAHMSCSHLIFLCPHKIPFDIWVGNQPIPFVSISTHVKSQAAQIPSVVVPLFWKDPRDQQVLLWRRAANDQRQFWRNVPVLPTK